MLLDGMIKMKNVKVKIIVEDEIEVRLVRELINVEVKDLMELSFIIDDIEALTRLITGKGRESK